MRSAMTSGRATGTVLIVLAVAATLAALLLPVHWFDGNRTIAISRSGWQDDGKGTWKTEYGPLTALDRDFMQRVRAAALWELPAGRFAKERGTRESVRTAGDHLVDGHADLDRRAIKAARTLRVPLPAKATGSERQYLEELAKTRGTKFDRVFVNRLRKQAGSVFGLIGLVRDQTRNSMVRSLTTRANTVVLDHITVLEDTGLVDYRALGEGN